MTKRATVGEVSTPVKRLRGAHAVNEGKARAATYDADASCARVLAMLREMYGDNE